MTLSVQTGKTIKLDAGIKEFTICDSDSYSNFNHSVNTTGAFYVDGTQVVSNQGAHVPYATTVEDIFGVVNAIIDRLRAHGLIASS